MAANDPLRFLRADFADLEAYTPVKPLDVLAREIGVPVDRLVKLDANENLYGPHPALRDAIANADLHIYPDPGQLALREAIAEYLDVTPEMVVAGSGADDLIDIIIRLVLPEAIVVTPPTFGMYGFLAKLTGARTIEAPLDADFRPDLCEIARAVNDGAKVVFLTSPNNPTGTIVDEADVRTLCALDALIVIDEAYAEFSRTSVVSLVAEYPNLIVLRTFSKWAAIAGLRCGYAITDPRLAERMMAIKQPYNVNIAADVAARAALEHRAEISESVRSLVAERERMVALVSALGWLEPVPSQANFVLFRVAEGRQAHEVAASLRGRGVLVRYYDRPELRGYIRISAGRPEDTDRLLDALKEL
ncbi:hypothetical protein AYO38_03385 [bacterium SCGC AG-212-C10]|nr:hypothetical protein AYO38_03385 [bacterium SCGC AG-212-C10]